MTAPLTPPYPADTLAKGWRFELDMEKFKRSDTWKLAKSGAVRGALLLLWAEAWQESPCGTLPNDDNLLALTIDMPDAAFAKHRAVLMRGWWLADDGRLYHDTITARVLAMLAKRASDAERAANRRARKAESAASPPEVTRDAPVTPPVVGHEFDTKHQAPVKEKVSKPSASHPVAGAGDRRFDAFWQAYPRKVGKDAARKAFGKRKPDDELLAAMIRAVDTQRASPGWLKDGGEFIPHPSTWLNEGRWQDEAVSIEPAGATQAKAEMAKTQAYLAEQAAHASGPQTPEQRAATAQRLRDARQAITARVAA